MCGGCWVGVLQGWKVRVALIQGWDLISKKGRASPWVTGVLGNCVVDEVLE